jgi:hypothetical protein
LIGLLFIQEHLVKKPYLEVRHEKALNHNGGNAVGQLLYHGRYVGEDGSKSWKQSKQYE